MTEKMMDIGDGSLDGWIPQQGQMRLIDRVLAVDAQRAVAELEVPADGLFVQDGRVGSWVGLEYMAQTISVWAGGRARRAGGVPKLGLLLGSRRYTACCGSFASGARLRVEVHLEFMGDNGLGLFDCRILMQNEELATAQLTVFEPEDAGQFLSAGAAP